MPGAAFQYQRFVGPLGTPAAPMTVEWLPTMPAWLPPISRQPALLARGAQLLGKDPSEGSSLTWLPKRPDWITTKVSIRTGSQLTWVQNLDPLPNAPPPTELTWDSNYPAQIPPLSALLRMSTALRASGGVLGRRPFEDLRWGPTYPGLLLRRRLPVAAFPASAAREVGALLDLPKRGGWRPTYPAWIARRLPQTLPSFLSRPTAPLILLDRLPCVEWTNEAVICPGFEDEAIFRSTFAEETCTLPGDAEEDLC